MQHLTTDLMDQACRLFLSQAYPGGEAAIPAKRRHVLNLPAGCLMLDQLGPDSALCEYCQAISAKAGGVRTVLVRLGCGHYPNLKLKVQLVGDGNEAAWLFSVDTHDAFSAASFLPPPDHAEAAAWTALQRANVALKERIEAAWEQAGLLTFNGLLRRDLQKNKPSLS